MSVIFESKIKINTEGTAWYIELTDTVDGRVANCSDLQEFEAKVEEFGNDYGGRIDEVKWSSAEDVPQSVIHEIRLGLEQFKEEENFKEEN